MCLWASFSLASYSIDNRSEAVPWRYSVKKVLLEISQNSQENSCEFCEISKNIFSYRTPAIDASVRFNSQKNICLGYFFSGNSIHRSKSFSNREFATADISSGVTIEFQQIFLQKTIDPLLPTMNLLTYWL